MSHALIVNTSVEAPIKRTFSTFRPPGPDTSPDAAEEMPMSAGVWSLDRMSSASSNSTGGRRFQARRCSRLGLMVTDGLRWSVTVLIPYTVEAKSSRM